MYCIAATFTRGLTARAHTLDIRVHAHPCSRRISQNRVTKVIHVRCSRARKSFEKGLVTRAHTRTGTEIYTQTVYAHTRTFLQIHILCIRCVNIPVISLNVSNVSSFCEEKNSSVTRSVCVCVWTCACV